MQRSILKARHVSILIPASARARPFDHRADLVGLLAVLTRSYSAHDRLAVLACGALNAGSQEYPKYRMRVHATIERCPESKAVADCRIEVSNGATWSSALSLPASCSLSENRSSAGTLEAAQLRPVSAPLAG